MCAAPAAVTKTRRDALIEELARQVPEATIGGAALGLHLIAWLRDGADETQISKHAAARGVALHTLHHHSVVTAPRPPALLLGYGLLAEPAIPRAVEQLAASTRRVTRVRALTEPRFHDHTLCCDSSSSCQAAGASLREPQVAGLISTFLDQPPVNKGEENESKPDF